MVPRLFLVVSKVLLGCIGHSGWFQGFSMWLLGCMGVARKAIVVARVFGYQHSSKHLPLCSTSHAHLKTDNYIPLTLVGEH